VRRSGIVRSSALVVAARARWRRILGWDTCLAYFALLAGNERVPTLTEQSKVVGTGVLFPGSRRFARREPTTRGEKLRLTAPKQRPQF